MKQYPLLLRLGILRSDVVSLVPEQARTKLRRHCPTA